MDRSKNFTYWTVYDELIAGAPSGTVTMNPNYVKGGDMYVFENRTRATVNRIYTEAKRTKTRNKQANVGKHVLLKPAVIKKAKVKWRKYLNSTTKFKDQEYGAIMEILYHTGARVGAVDTSTEVAGIRTLRRKHVKLNMSRKTLRLSYYQKSGPETYEISMKGASPLDKPHVEAVLEIVDGLLNKTRPEGKDPNDRLFSVSYELIKRRVKTLFNNPNVTVHKLRHLKATYIAKPLFENTSSINKLLKMKDELSPSRYAAEVNKFVKGVAEAVGTQLNHTIKMSAGAEGKSHAKVTGAIALRAYILPQLVMDFYDKVDAPLPQTLKNIYLKKEI